MVDLPHTLAYATITTIVTAITLGAGIGSAKTSRATLKALDIQPAAQIEIMKASIIGLAFIETSAILGFIITIMLLTMLPAQEYAHWALLGIMSAVALPGFLVGIFSALPAQEACFSIARQPFFSQNILNIMLITQSMIQTPLLFGFLIALVIIVKLPGLAHHIESFVLFAAGLALGLGSIGPTIGLSRFAQNACKGVSINRKAYSQLIPFTLLSQAIIETPLIFALLLSLILLGTASSFNSQLDLIRTLAAALCIGIGTFGPSISSSKTASAAGTQIAINPQNYGILSQASVIGQGLIDAAAVYALIVGVLLIFI
jgi:F0F1-type ATP synthase membrane subunit c/vacuolar-type H+-ATPase subunit K